MATTLTVYEACRAGTAITKVDCTSVVAYQMALTGLEFLVVENGSAGTIVVTLSENGTYTSNTGYQDDEGGSILTTVTRVYGPFTNVSRWKDSNGYLQIAIDTTSALVKLYAVRNPVNSTQADTEVA